MAKHLGNILSAAAFTVLFAFSFAFIAIRVSGLLTYVVTGGSMEPSIHKGSLVLVQPVSPSEVKVGDVITFQQYDQTTTHRVTAITRSAQGLSFATKGDANAVPDPEDKSFPGQVGVVRGSLPLAGYLTASAQAYWRLVLTLVAAVIFFSCAGALIFKKQSAAPVPAPVRMAARRPRLATVAVDADEAWRAHIAWLERSTRRQQVA